MERSGSGQSPVPPRLTPRRRRQPLRLLLLFVLAVGLLWWQGREPEDPSPRLPSASAPSPTPTDASAQPRANSPDTTRRDLAEDERRGGHTIARHVGRTDAQLRDRLERERGISAASTYTDLPTAERTVERTLTREAPRVSAWRARGDNRPNLALDYRGAPNEVIGRVWRRNRRTADAATDAVVVLRAQRSDFYVLTSYPELGR